MPSPLSDAKEVVPLYPATQLPPDAAGQVEQDGESGFISNVHVPTLSVYLLASGANGCGVVVCPGGGYGGLACGHEGRDIARWLNDNGIAAFILKYRLPSAGHRHPAPLGALLQTRLRVRDATARPPGHHV